ncbi:MAG: hypothetical protein LBG69_09600 [Zoogloeaceae bacterium]|nr:hypothetical protein [Zoogloeaceae bacterium]
MRRFFGWVVRAVLPFAAVFSLTGCINDGASYHADNGRQILSIVRENNFFWEKQVGLSVVVARMPECQRRHFLQKSAPKAHIELWQPGENTFVLRLGKRMYVAENRTCEGFSALDEEPPGGLGAHLGTFGESDGVFVFVPAEPAAER